MKPVGITVQKVGGQWYVSPVGTFADVLLAALAALDNQELTAIIDAAVKLSGSVLTGGLLGDTSLAGSSDSGSSDTGNSDTGNSDTGDADTGDATGFEKCFAASDYVTYSAWDHRAFDGAYAAGFLVKIKEDLETRDWSAEL